MQFVKSLFKKENMNQLALAIMLLIYVLIDVKTPNSLAELVDNLYGQIIVILGALALFSNSHPVVGVLSLYSAYLLISRSSRETGTLAIQENDSSEENKLDEMIESNFTPRTLEEEVVKNMIPYVQDVPNGDPTYKPVLDSNITSSALV